TGVVNITQEDISELAVLDFPGFNANGTPEKDKTKVESGSRDPSAPLPGFRQFNLSEMEDATNDFSYDNRIGAG
ncbi:unnamed protein product, partial [Urochloa humidicola]